MKTLLVIIALLSADIAWGEGTLVAPSKELIGLDEFSIEYFKYEARRDAYYPEYPTQGRWEGGSKVNYTLGIFPGLYWRNTLFFSYEKQGGQIRDAGWDFELGARVTKWLDVYRYHRSSHGLEYIHPDNTKFNVVDTYGIRINLVH